MNKDIEDYERAIQTKATLDEQARLRQQEAEKLNQEAEKNQEKITVNRRKIMMERKVQNIFSPFYMDAS